MASTPLLPDDIFKKRSELLAKRKKIVQEKDQISVVTFHIGSTCYAVPIAQLAGIRRTRTIRLIPGSEKRICGLLTVQGEAYTIFRLIENSGNKESNSAGYALLLSSPDHLRLGFYVDTVDTIIPIKRVEKSNLQMSELGILSKYFEPKDGKPFTFLDLDSILESVINREKRL